jgi:two-component system, OmpR family, sensor histidine kinase KdpD
MDSEVSYPSSVLRFLDMIKASRLGKLKIYIGLAAGVGKTYRMLQEAHELMKNDVDVVIGYVETHKRADTDKLVEGLLSLERKKIFYKGKMLDELDIDALLLRKPQVALIDELAHTNVPGSRNEKRWQDVMEAIEAGISVISTLNIQHIESIREVVEKITEVEIRERVPDVVIQKADEIVNVDLTIEELIDRLKDGKIYDKTKIDHALQNFFQKDKLLQLRDLALKEVSRQISNKVYREILPTERTKLNTLITAISTNYHSAARLIRRSSRLVNLYNSAWFVIYVITPKESVERINTSDQRHLINNLKLAADLGAEVIQSKDNDIAKAIAELAREKEAGLIVMGKPHLSFIMELFNKNIFKKLINYTNDLNLDILMVTNNEKHKD